MSSRRVVAVADWPWRWRAETEILPVPSVLFASRNDDNGSVHVPARSARAVQAHGCNADTEIAARHTPIPYVLLRTPGHSTRTTGSDLRSVIPHTHRPRRPTEGELELRRVQRTDRGRVRRGLTLTLP